MISPTQMKVLPSNLTPVAILAVRNWNDQVTSVEQQDPCGVPKPYTEIRLTLQEQHLEDYVQPFPGLRSERRIVRAAGLIRINP